MYGVLILVLNVCLEEPTVQLLWLVLLVLLQKRCSMERQNGLFGELKKSFPSSVTVNCTFSRFCVFLQTTFWYYNLFFSFCQVLHFSVLCLFTIVYLFSTVGECREHISQSVYQLVDCTHMWRILPPFSHSQKRHTFCLRASWVDIHATWSPT